VLGAIAAFLAPALLAPSRVGPLASGLGFLVAIVFLGMQGFLVHSDSVGTGLAVFGVTGGGAVILPVLGILGLVVAFLVSRAVWGRCRAGTALNGVSRGRWMLAWLG